MNHILKLCALGLLSAFLAGVVKTMNPSFSLPMKVGVACVFCSLLLSSAKPLFSELSALVEQGLGEETGGALFAALGVALLSGTVGEICRDVGEGTVAGYVESAGKIGILLLSLPTLRSLLSAAEGLLGV